DPECCTPLRQQQHAGQQKTYTENGEIPGTAQIDDLNATYCQRQAEKNAQHPTDDDRHEVLPFLVRYQALLRWPSHRPNWRHGSLWKWTGPSRIFSRRRLADAQSSASPTRSSRPLAESVSR